MRRWRELCGVLRIANSEISTLLLMMRDKAFDTAYICAFVDLADEDYILGDPGIAIRLNSYVTQKSSVWK